MGGVSMDQPKTSGELERRLVIGGCSLAVVALFILFSPLLWFRPLFALALGGIATLALWEYYQLCRHKGYMPSTLLGCCGGFLIVWVRFMQVQGWIMTPLHLWVLPLLLSLWFLIFVAVGLKRQELPIVSVATSFFGLLYVALPLSLIGDILYTIPSPVFGAGQWWLMFLIGITVLSDVGGYAVGRAIGKHPLASKISPRKTWEGALGGLFFALAGGLLWAILGGVEISLVEAGVLSVILGGAGQFGDLCESLFKRDAGVKDSNRLPGLGGMLDVLDSFLFTTPLLYLYLSLFWQETL